MTRTPRRTALITGAGGGMGRAITRALGATYDLVLTDVVAEPLARFSETLGDEGYTVIDAVAGDLGDPAILERLAGEAGRGEGLGALVHTAGLSPAQSDWKTILRVNSLVTDSLVKAIEPILQPGSVGVLIASMAGHNTLPIEGADALIDAATGPDDLDAVGDLLFPGGRASPGAGEAAAGMAYVLSKRAVIRLCERRAAAWGARGARLVSVSPGLILTPMGRKEAEANSATRQTIDAQPVPRWGTVMDIAAAVGFLVGPTAGFITGCDLRVDGGATAMTRNPPTGGAAGTPA